MVRKKTKLHLSEDENIDNDQNRHDLAVNVINENDKEKNNLIESIIMKKCTTRRPRVYWSDEEVGYLRRGIEEFGEGSWNTILAKYKTYFKKGRKSNDLKDKFRLLNKTSSYYTNDKKNFVETSLTNLGKFDDNPIIYYEKYPFDAAVRIAKKLDIKKGEMVRISLMDKDDRKKIHVYLATKGDIYIQLRKEQIINLNVE